MGEIGQVLSVKEDLVEIALNRPDACGHCNACSIGVEKEATVLEAENGCHAKVGEMVEISLEESQFLLAVVIMYILPLIGLLSGIIIGYLLGGKMGMDPEVIGLIFGFLLLAMTYGLIKKNEARFHTKKFRPVAIKIVAYDETVSTCQTNQKKR